MYHVVVGVDADIEQLDEKVDAIAALPASIDSVRVTVVHVSDEVEPDDVPSVSDALELFQTRDIDVDARSVTGDTPAHALVEVAESMAVDLICVGGRQRTPAGKRQLKSGAQEVILRTDIPVLVTGETGNRARR